MEATRCGPTLKPDAGVARQRVARQEVSQRALWQSWAIEIYRIARFNNYC